MSGFKRNGSISCISLLQFTTNTIKGSDVKKKSHRSFRISYRFYWYIPHCGGYKEKVTELIEQFL
jgi:uncharacterized protein YcfL